MKKRFSGPQIVAKLRQADVLIGQGKNVTEVCKEIEISQQAYYRDYVPTVVEGWRGLNFFYLSLPFVFPQVLCLFPSHQDTISASIAVYIRLSSGSVLRSPKMQQLPNAAPSCRHSSCLPVESASEHLNEVTR